MRDPKMTVSSRHRKAGAHRNSHRLAACTGPAQGQACWGRTAEMGSGHGLPPLAKKLSPLITAHKGKFSLLQQNSMGIQATLKGRSHTQQQKNNTK